MIKNIKKIYFVLVSIFILTPFTDCFGASDEKSGSNRLPAYGMDSEYDEYRGMLLFQGYGSDGKPRNYYIRNDLSDESKPVLDALEAAYAGDPCWYYQTRLNPDYKDGIKAFFKNIVASCRERLPHYRQILRANNADLESSFDKSLRVVNRGARGYFKNTQDYSGDAITEDTKLETKIKALKSCSITTEELRAKIFELREEGKLKVSRPMFKAPQQGNNFEENDEYAVAYFQNMVNECMRNLGKLDQEDYLWGFASAGSFKPDNMVSSNSKGGHTEELVCDQKAFYEDEVLESIVTAGMTSSYHLNTNLVFDVDADISLDRLFLYVNGTLIVCDNGMPQKLVYPVYSGMEECQDSKYSSMTHMGGVPAGVYLLRERDKQDTRTIESTDTRIWGNFRVILNPAEETNTYGRHAMYLHGREHSCKIEERRSAGCINIGWETENIIDPYVDRDVLLFVLPQSGTPAQKCVNRPKQKCEL